MPKKDKKLVELGKLIEETYSIEELELTDTTIIAECKMKIDTFVDVRDPIKIEHKLSDIVMIVLFCVFANIDEWKKMELFAKTNILTLKKLLDLPNGIPSHDTLQRVFGLIDPNELHDLLISLFEKAIKKGINKLMKEDTPLYQQEIDEEKVDIIDIIAGDGKEVRKSVSSYDPEGVNFRMLNVYSTELSYAIKSVPIDEKSNEIPKLAEVLKGMNLKGIVVTFDALNTQKQTIKIINEKKGFYVAALKGNQHNAHEEILKYFQEKELLNNIKKNGRYKLNDEEKNKNYLIETEYRKRKIIVREYYITDDTDWFESKNLWSGLKCFGYQVTTVTNRDTNEVKTEERYYLTNLSCDVNIFSLSVRRHWEVENILHRHLDMTFHEDFIHTRNKRALHNLTIVRRFVLAVLNLIKATYGKKKSFSEIRSLISWNFEVELLKMFNLLALLKK